MARGSCRDDHTGDDQGRRGTPRRRHRRHRASAPQRREEGRAQAGPAARRARGDHHGRGGRVPDPLRVLALVEPGGPAQTRRQPVHRARELRHGALQPDLVAGVLRHAVHHRGQRELRARVRHAAGDRHAPHDRRPRPGAHLGARALRDRHGGRCVLLAIRVDGGPGLDHTRRLRAAHPLLALDMDHHPGRGLEDGPVHGAAAHGGPRAGPRGPAQGRVDGRRERVEAVLDDHRAADQARDPRGAAVPYVGRVPGLRQHLRADQRGERHQLGVDARLQQPHPRTEPRHRLDDVGSDLHHDRDHRLHLHQGVRRGGARCEPGRAEVAMETETTNRKLTWWGINIIVLLYAFIPVVWILTLSLKDPSTLNDGKYFPVSPSWDSYAKIFTNDDFIRALINSIGICLISTFVAIVFGTMAAYAIARLDFPGKTAIVAAALLVSMFPQIALVTPLFKILTAIGLFDTWLGLIIPYVTFALPLAIYTLSAFFREIPWDLEKAAKMDGATPYQAFRQVITPLAMPGVFTTAILVFISCWNDFLFALSLTSTSNARTVPAAMSYFTGATTFEKPTGPIAAAAILITIPIVLFVLVFQRRIVAGLTSGAVKG